MFDINMMSILRRPPQAVAHIKGSPIYPNIEGRVSFYAAKSGVIVVSMISNLPCGEGECEGSVLGFHIHSGASCTGDDMDYFKNAMTHYNPKNCNHPYHAGDMPPLFSAGGRAFSAFLTDRFTVKEIIGKTVIIHSMPDDFTTQPSGNSGEKIACGVIKLNRYKNIGAR